MNKWTSLTGSYPIVIACYGSASSAGYGYADDSVWDCLRRAISEVSAGESLDLIIRLRGGALGGLRDVIEAITARGYSTRAVVWEWATSAGALLSLGCGTVLMSHSSYLGSFSPQILDVEDPPMASEYIDFIAQHPEIAPLPFATQYSLMVASQWYQEVSRWLANLAAHYLDRESLILETGSILTDHALPHEAHVFMRDLPGLPLIIRQTDKQQELVDELNRHFVGIDSIRPIDGGLVPTLLVSSQLRTQTYYAVPLNESERHRPAVDD